MSNSDQFDIDIHLNLVFVNTIGYDIISKLSSSNETTISDNENIIKILNLISEYFPIKNISSDVIIKEIYILYIYSYLLFNLNSNLKLKESEFLETVYYPNLIYILAFHLKNASKFFQKLIRLVYKEAKVKLETVLMFYVTFYNSEYIVIKNDIINIFLNNMIFDINPLELDDYKSYYLSVFQYIFYLYLERQSSGIIDQEIQISSGQDLSLSSRYNIYKNGIKITQIQSMCHESSTLKKIYSNFNKVKTDIISNELQKLYTVMVEGNDMTDDKMLILKFNMEDEKLIDIQKKYPLIYKLLRSVKIKSTETGYSNYDKLMIKDALRTSIYLKLKMHMNETHSSILADAISIKLEQSITSGRYLDPYTLTTLEVRGTMFLRQLSLFINMILDHIDTVDNLNKLYE